MGFAMEFPTDYSGEIPWEYDETYLLSVTRPSFVCVMWKMVLNPGEEVAMRVNVAPAGFSIPDQLVGRGGGRFLNFGVAINAQLDVVESCSFILPANFRWGAVQYVISGTGIMNDKTYTYTVM